MGLHTCYWQYLHSAGKIVTVCAVIDKAAIERALRA